MTPPSDDCVKWTVAAAAFVVNLIAGGYATSFGVFLDQFLEYFSESSTTFQTTFIASLLQNVPLLIAPLTFILVHRYGSRCICLLGGVLLCVGHVLAFVAGDIAVLYIGLGIVAGIGLSFVYVPALTMVEIYFNNPDKRGRNRHVIGISQFGSGLGTMLLANLIAFLIQKYGWRGASLIVGGILFNLCICGALFWPLRTAASKRTARFLVEDDEDPRDLPELEALNLARRYTLSPMSAFDRVSGNLMFSSMVQLPTYLPNDDDYEEEIHENKKVKSASVEDISSGSSDHQVAPRRQPLDDMAFVPDLSKHVLLKNAIRSAQERHQMKVCQSAPNLWGGPPRIETWLVPADELNGGEHFMSSTAIMSEQSITKSKQAFRTIKWDLWGPALCKNPSYFIFYVSTVLLFMSSLNPLYFYPNHARMLGVSEANAAVMIGLIGIADTLGQPVYGLIASKPHVSYRNLYACVVIILGVIIGCAYLSEGLAGLIIVAAFYGFNVGVIRSLGRYILTDLVTRHQFITAYSMLNFGQGLAGLFGAPIGGLLKDKTGDYTLTFIASGACTALAGFFVIFGIGVVDCCRKNPDSETEAPSPSRSRRNRNTTHESSSC